MVVPCNGFIFSMVYFSVDGIRKVDHQAHSILKVCSLSVRYLLCQTIATKQALTVTVDPPAPHCQAELK